MGDADLLKALRKHLRELVAMPVPDARRNFPLFRQVRDAREFNAVPIDLPRWFGRAPSDAERMRVYRALARLEKSGRVMRVALGHLGAQFTHVCVEAARAEA